jgi:hypothetical protein
MYICQWSYDKAPPARPFSGHGARWHMSPLPTIAEYRSRNKNSYEVMFEQMTQFSCAYTYHLCGVLNNLDLTLFWQCPEFTGSHAHSSLGASPAVTICPFSLPLLCPWCVYTPWLRSQNVDPCSGLDQAFLPFLFSWTVRAYVHTFAVDLICG